MRRRQAVRVGLAVAVAGGLAGSLLTVLPTGATANETGGTNGDAESAAVSDAGADANLDWGKCPEDTITDPQTSQLQCATLSVPLDYDKPQGRTIDIMISRIPSDNPDKRRGVLLLNPGGPGGASLPMPDDLVRLGIPNSVLDSYDLISFDTRGVGHSSPVSCGFRDDQEYYGNIQPYAPDRAAVAEQAKVAKAVAEQCGQHDEDGTLRHISTANIARDMDRIRTALGEEKVSFFGLSYGSALGATYASMFAERTDRVVLDSNIGNTVADSASIRRFGLGKEQAFGDYASWLAERHDSYELGRTPGEVRRNYLELAERLDEKPIAGVDGAVFRLSGFAGLYSETSFASSAQLWQSLAASDEDAVRRHLEEHPLRQPGLTGAGMGTTAAPDGNDAGTAKAGDPTSAPSPFDNAWSAYLAVTCNDTNWSEDVSVYQRRVAIDRERFPLYGAAAANVSPCAYWPYEPQEPPAEFEDEGPTNILVMQNLRDPATPHRGGELTRQRFGDRARLVSADEVGHGTYVYGKNACATNVATRFLVDGEMPADDVSCSASTTAALDLDPAAEQRREATLRLLGR